MELKGYRGKASDGTVLPLELAYFVNAVYGQLQLCTNPSRGGVNTLSPPPPSVCRRITFFAIQKMYTRSNYDKCKFVTKCRILTIQSVTSFRVTFVTLPFYSMVTFDRQPLGKLEGLYKQKPLE